MQINKSTQWYEKATQKSNIWVILGGRGSGKSTASFHILDFHYKFTKRPLFVYKHPQPSLLPPHIKSIDNLDHLPKGAVCMLDEASTQFDQHSFKSEASKTLSEGMRIARHNEISLIFITQNGNMLTKDVKRLVDIYILRAPSLVQVYDEKGIVKQMYKNHAKRFKEEENRLKGYVIVDSNYEAFVKFNLPTYWNDKLSTVYNGEEEIEDVTCVIDTLEV